MDRSFWLSILLVVLVLSGRAALEAAKGLEGEALLAELDALDGGASSVELADRVTEAAGCVRGFRPEVRSCWYAWAEPSRFDYLHVVAERVRSDGIGEAIRWSALAIPLWLAAALSAWKVTRPRGQMRPPPPATAVPNRRPPGHQTS
jgi:hypothetical protein